MLYMAVIVMFRFFRNFREVALSEEEFFTKGREIYT